MGPTASGKTDLAIALLQAFPFELISVDAAQVYRGMDIGTGKPSAETLAGAPHRLIDIRDPEQPYSAADFCHDARQAMANISARGNIPLLVGGTMFYFQALEKGMSVLPSADPGIRQRLEQEANGQGWPALHAKLKAIDPDMAARIEPHDAQRIQRALEIWELSGQRPSAVMQQSRSGPLPYRLIKLAIAPTDRGFLHDKINRRFLGMLEAGLEEEVKTLLSRGLGIDLPAMRIVGYRQMRQYLHGELDYDAMVAKACAATRQLAKRQLTWLRGGEGVECFDTLESELYHRVCKYLRSCGLN